MKLEVWVPEHRVIVDIGKSVVEDALRDLPTEESVVYALRGLNTCATWMGGIPDPLIASMNKAQCDTVRNYLLQQAERYKREA